MAQLIQFGASLVAIAILVALAGLARIARPAPRLSDAEARALFSDEFPGAQLDGVWVAADGRGAIARAGDQALILFRLGDAFVGRAMSWDAARAADLKAGELRLAFGDIAAPKARLLMGDTIWPPREAVS